MTAALFPSCTFFQQRRSGNLSPPHTQSERHVSPLASLITRSNTILAPRHHYQETSNSLLDGQKAAAMSLTAAAGEAAADGSANANPYISIEERCFLASLMCLEGHFTEAPPMGPKTTTHVVSMVSKTLEKTHGSKEVRYVVCGFWMGISRLTWVLGRLCRKM